MMHIDLKEAQSHLYELVKQAAEGEEIVITQNNIPLVKLIAASSELPESKRQFGRARGLIKMSDDFDTPLEDFNEYM